MVSTVAEPTKDDNPQTHFRELRDWVMSNITCGHPVREASYQMALSACAHRLIKFGPDEALNVYTARDLLRLLIFVNGKIAEWIMRTAFTRAIIEGDSLVYEKLASTLFIQECRIWYWKLVEGLVGKSVNPQEVTEWVDQLPKEEKAVARLLACRLFPDLANVTWLEETENPQIQAGYLQILSSNPRHQGFIDQYLRTHPDCRNWTYHLR